MEEDYDCVLKFLVVGDMDVGKNEILSGLETWNEYNPITTILKIIEGKRVKLIFSDTSITGHVSTELNRRLRGAHGIILIYDITNKCSFKGIDRWLGVVNVHAYGVPKFLIGNRLHLAFRREVPTKKAELYASKNNMLYFEISYFNCADLICDLAKMAFQFNGMERMFLNKVSSLQDLCCRRISKFMRSADAIDSLLLPSSITSNLKSYTLKNYRKTTIHRNSCSIL